MRCLASSNPFAVDLCLTHVKEKVAVHKIIPKLNKLVNDNELLVEHSTNALNKLDNLLF